MLEEAEDKSQPVLERLEVSFIFCTNLDEFFMIRVAGLKRQVRSDVNELTSDKMTAQEQRDSIYEILTPLVEKQYKVFNEEILPELEEHKINFIKYTELNESDKKTVDDYFEDEIFPVLTPLAIDNVHPFPNLQTEVLLAINFDDPDTAEVEEKVCVIQIPSNISRFYSIESGNRDSIILS
ncbi:MAG: hypothetical protein IPH77_12885 [Ignavibacteria bacterium]|nr:hypothetical protein [Ignavibacteria bacterium]